MADTTTELEVLDQIVDVLGGQSGQYETVVPVLQQIKELLASGITDPESITEAVTAWLDDHPEATTTVQDGSVTGPKIADDTIPDAKLVQTGGVLEKVNGTVNRYVVKTYTEVEPASTHTGNRVYYDPTYLRIAQTSAGETRAYNVYEVTKGTTYRVYGFGYDNYMSILAAVGDVDIVESGASSAALLQVIDTGNTTGFNWVTVEVEIEHDGYLYVNCQTSQMSKVEKLTTVTKYTTDTNGIYISNGTYYHFTQTSVGSIIRKFIRRGPNNLLQWAGTYLGSVDENGVDVDTTIDEYSTDIIGPVSIFNLTLWPGVYGLWAGGNHGRTVEGVVCPTAEQVSMRVLVDGETITNDGIYYGNVLIETQNKIYFPQSITGNTFTGATQAFTENRFYYLTNKMDVKIRLDAVEDVRISTYYGMQAVTIAYDEISAFNNNFLKAKSSLTEATNLLSKEGKLSLRNTTSGLTLDMELKSVGLGTYQMNTGSGTGASAGYVYIPIQSGASRVEKIYYMLAINTTAEQVKNGMSLFWEGTYNIYFE